MRIGGNVTLAIILATIAAACGGGGDDDTSTGTTSAPATENGESAQTTPAEAPDTGGDDDSSGDDGGDPAQPATGSDAEIPIARFAAHGPQDPGTIGPECASGVDNQGGDMFRFTPAESWVWTGMSGGSGPDSVTIRSDNDEARLKVTGSAYDYDTLNLPGWEVVGPAGADADLDGEIVSIMEIVLESRPGYAIVDLAYLGPLPLVEGGEALATVAVTSDTEGRPTLEEAQELLSTVRVERCAIVRETQIWGPGGGVHLVPRFEPDPLGKPYPDQPQPAYAPPGSALDAYSVEQVAYLLPVEADKSMCAAEKFIEQSAGDPLAQLTAFAPTGTNKEMLDAIVASC